MRQNGLSSRSSDNTNNVAKSNESCGTHCNETDGASVNYTDFGALVLLSSWRCQKRIQSVIYRYKLPHSVRFFII